MEAVRAYADSGVGTVERRLRMIKEAHGIFNRQADKICSISPP
jgi:hypothetical protein